MSLPLSLRPRFSFVFKGQLYLQSVPQRGSTRFFSNCFLVLTCHPHLSTGNWSDSASPFGLHSGQELDHLKYPTRRKIEKAERNICKEREFSIGNGGGWEGLLRFRQKQRASLIQGSEGSSLRGRLKSLIWTFRTCKRKALQIPTPLKSNKKTYHSGLTLSPMETRVC